MRGLQGTLFLKMLHNMLHTMRLWQGRRALFAALVWLLKEGGIISQTSLLHQPFSTMHVWAGAGMWAGMWAMCELKAVCMCRWQGRAGQHCLPPWRNGWVGGHENKYHFGLGLWAVMWAVWAMWAELWMYVWWLRTWA